MAPTLSYPDIALVILFCIGYFFIAIEHITHINKATVALLLAVACWSLAYIDERIATEDMQSFFMEHIATTAQIVLFLLGALGIVEIISSHDGFHIIAESIKVTTSRSLLWMVGLVTFFLSAVLDNLTTTIVMVALIQKLLKVPEQRMLMGGAIVIAANAGGAWSPIGDVTTTMLWIGGNISTWPIIRDLFAPSLLCTLVSLTWLHFYIPNTPLEKAEEEEKATPEELALGHKLFYVGIGSLLFVPILRALTGLPPFMGVLLGLGLVWLITDLAHRDYHHRIHLKMPAALSKIDLSSVLFFLGILLSVAALQTEGILTHLANSLHYLLGDVRIIAVVIGILSAIIDNVPLVAGSMGMYDLATYPANSTFWQLIAFCAGTGGSMLIIGSAAGVAYMSLEKVTFGWYLKRISLPALVGYFGGVFLYLMLHA